MFEHLVRCFVIILVVVYVQAQAKSQKGACVSDCCCGKTRFQILTEIIKEYKLLQSALGKDPLSKTNANLKSVEGAISMTRSSPEPEISILPNALKPTKKTSNLDELLTSAYIKAWHADSKKLCEGGISYGKTVHDESTGICYLFVVKKNTTWDLTSSDCSHYTLNKTSGEAAVFDKTNLESVTPLILKQYKFKSRFWAKTKRQGTFCESVQFHSKDLNAPSSKPAFVPVPCSAKLKYICQFHMEETECDEERETTTTKAKTAKTTKRTTRKPKTTQMYTMTDLYVQAQTHPFTKAPKTTATYYGHATIAKSQGSQIELAKNLDMTTSAPTIVVATTNGPLTTILNVQATTTAIIGRKEADACKKITYAPTIHDAVHKRCYMLMEEKLNWNTSFDECSLYMLYHKKGELAMFNNVTLLQRPLELIKTTDPKTRNWWVSLRQDANAKLGSEEGWQWRRPKGKDISLDDANWLTPLKEKRCGAIEVSQDGLSAKWKAKDCRHKLKYICEFVYE